LNCTIWLKVQTTYCTKYVFDYHRGGTRGGKDQFSWDTVKEAKDKDYYLGASVKAVSGRWQKGKDVFWYTKDKGSESSEAMKDEIRAVKEREEELMRQALGLPTQKKDSAMPEDATKHRRRDRHRDDDKEYSDSSYEHRRRRRQRRKHRDRESQRGDQEDKKRRRRKRERESSEK
jgi:hypothetical protein